VFVLVVAAWSISTAKHFGSFEANQAMLWPDEYLPRVAIEFKGNSSGGLYFLY
jgi:hypothetical protein